MKLIIRRRIYLSSGRSRNARATTVVEMAVVMPLMLTILFGIIEFGWVFMVSQTLTNAAREGCRTAVLAGSSTQDVLNKVDRFMQNAGLQGYSTELTRATDGGNTETVIVKIPYATVSLLGGYFGPTNFDLKGYAAMLKEGSVSGGT